MRSCSALALAAVLLTCATDAPAQQRRAAPALIPAPLEAPASLPFRLVEGRPVVDVVIDGAGPFPFIVDSGAMSTLVSAEVGVELGSPMGRARVGDPSGGPAREAAIHQADEVVVGEGSVRLHDLRIIALDAPEIFERVAASGILGLSALAGNVVIFDFPAGRLEIVPGTLREGDGSLPWAEGEMPLPRLEIEVDGHRVVADLDTGSGRDIVLPRALLDSVTLSEGPEPDSLRLVTGVIEALSGRLDGEVRVGDVRIPDPAVLFQDRFPQANVGTSSLLGARLVVDPVAQRVWVGEGEGPRPEGP